MSSPPTVGLPEALERAACALLEDADAIRPANGDPMRLIDLLGLEAATRVLEWLLANETEAGCELTSAWVDDPEHAAEPVLRAQEENLPKAARKALRRAHHHLRSRGFSAPEKQTGAVVARLPSLGDEINEALVSSIDPTGTRMAFLAEGHPSGGARLFEVMISEERGVTEFKVFSTSRSRIRKFMREFSQRDSYPGIDAAPDAVRALIEHAARLQPENRPLPRGFSEYRSHFAAAAEHARPGQMAREALAGGGAAGAIESAVTLLRKGEIGPWPPDRASLQSIAAELDAVASSPIVLSRAAKREQTDAVLERALERVFSGPFAAASAERFDETAYVLREKGQEDEARACLAAADLFREGGGVDNPVARAMLEVVLEPVLSKLEEPDEATDAEPESLIVET